ncbi:MAG: hypothetical protein OEU68_18645 [Nitrospira sp.]|jgi:hypothetical protein|nr:hypothetical protein [Nitrospira sp.]MDH5320668.1 hypothetical protein [Nitrospira sp.]
MGCPWWICGLKNSGMVVCTIKRSKVGKVLLTIDGQQDSQGVEVTQAAHLRIFEEGEEDYGLAIVSCVKVLSDDGKPRSEESIDLSKLEMTAFFSFMDPNNPSVRMSPEIALWHFNTRFKKFADKDAKGRARELWLAYDEKYMGKDAEKSSGRRKHYENQHAFPSYT